MEGTISNFRGSHRSNVASNQVVIVVSSISKKDKAEDIVGKAVSWKSPAGKELKGKIAATHGNSGAVRAIFTTGLPGQCLGNKVKIE